MSEFTFEFDEELVEEAEQSGGSGFGVLETDIYKGATINFASLDKTGNGNDDSRDQHPFAIATPVYQIVPLGEFVHFDGSQSYDQDGGGLS